MTPKKFLMIVGGVLAGLVLLVVLFVGAVAGVVFYAIGNSEAAEAAKVFLRTNQKLRAEIGDIQGFGWFVTGGVNARNADGDARLNLKVIGERRNVNASVALFYKSGHKWRVSGASYKNEVGQIVELLDKYEDEPAAESRSLN